MTFFIIYGPDRIKVYFNWVGLFFILRFLVFLFVSNLFSLFKSHVLEQYKYLINVIYFFSTLNELITYTRTF